jgi:hypothetical protein
VHGEGGQATVEWVALVLLAALVLGAAAALRSPGDDRSLGELVAKRIARAPSEVGGDRRGLAPVRAGSAAPGPAPVPAASAPAPRPSAPRATAPPSRSGDAFPRLRGVGQVARHGWVVCLGYRRWRHDLTVPRAPTEPLPLGDALAIVNECLNPYDYLLGD